MKKIFLLMASLAIFSVFANAQLPGVLKKAGNKVNEKINKKANQGIDSTSGKNEKPKEIQGETPNGSEPAVVNKDTSAPASIKAFSKYDFVPGEKVIGFEDFSTGNIGDFPAGWNTSSSGEIVTVAGKSGRWLWITKPGVFVPEFTEKYPEDFTFEFDLLHGIPINGGDMIVALAELENVDQPQHWTLAPNRLHFNFTTASTGSSIGSSSYTDRKNGTSGVANTISTDLLSDNYNPVHISIWRQKERVRVYINQEKVWDIPKALAKEAKLNAIVFNTIYAEATVQHFIGNLRLAVGAPDTRNKLLTQNKWVTHGILFDVNSAAIKPESYGTLKEIANVLKENSDLKVKIVGHTDADGADAANLDLSKKRAASVKTALAKEFGIEEARMETDGKGESEPTDKANTPAAKANNRRVEFIKL